MFWIAFALKHENLGQWFQALFASHLGTCSPFGFEGQIDILQLRCIPAGVDSFLQFGGHFPQIVDGLNDRLLTFLYLVELVVSVADTSNLNLVESTRTFLPVSRDEGNGAALVE